MEDLDNITDEYDKEFISLMLTIERRSEVLNKYDKLRIKNWCKKLCQVTNNIEWKKNRNLHAICILDSVLNEHFEYPYNKFPPEGSVPILNKALVKSQLSKKFFIEASKIQNEEQNESNNNNDNTSNLNNDIKNVINNQNNNSNNENNNNNVNNEGNEEIINDSGDGPCKRGADERPDDPKTNSGRWWYGTVQVGSGRRCLLPEVHDISSAEPEKSGKKERCFARNRLCQRRML